MTDGRLLKLSKSNAARHRQRKAGPSKKAKWGPLATGPGLEPTTTTYDKLVRFVGAHKLEPLLVLYAVRAPFQTPSSPTSPVGGMAGEIGPRPFHHDNIERSAPKEFNHASCRASAPQARRT